MTTEHLAHSGGESVAASPMEHKAGWIDEAAAAPRICASPCRKVAPAFNGTIHECFTKLASGAAEMKSATRSVSLTVAN